MWTLWRTFFRGRNNPAASPPRRARLQFESLGPRVVPTTSPFFLDTHNQVWGAIDSTGKVSRFTGATGVQLSVGETSFMGVAGQFAVVRDAASHIAVLNGINDVLTTTTLVARDVVAGRDEVFFRDAKNKVHVLRLGVVMSDGRFAVTDLPTDVVAVRMKVGFDTTTGFDFLAFRAPNAHVGVLALFLGAPVSGDSGVTAVDFVAGNEKEVFVRRPGNLVEVVRVDAVTGATVTFLPKVTTGQAAVEMGVSRNNPSGDDYLAYRAPDSSVHWMNYNPGAGTVAHFDVKDTNGKPVKARQVVAGVAEIFIRDLTNQVGYFTHDGTGTAVSKETKTGQVATRLVDTSFTIGSGVIDQIAVSDRRGNLLVSQNNAGGTDIDSFFDTGFSARTVLGYNAFP
jgi:hypothetical protein